MKTLEVQTVYAMSNEEYRARPEISRSDASRYRGVYGGRAQRFAEVYKRSLFSGNAATSFGTLVDVAFEELMSGRDWRSRVVVPPAGVLAADGSKRGGAFRAWKEQLSPGVLEASAPDFEKIGLIIESAREHELAAEILDDATHAQASVFWVDENDHARKARADIVRRNGAWADIKTTSSSWRTLKYSFREFGYDWQAAWYTDAALAAGADPFVFRFIVVQTFPPFDTAVVSLTEDDLARARIEISETLAAMRRRRETGEWVSREYHEEMVLSLG